jgi:hypothetical protein
LGLKFRGGRIYGKARQDLPAAGSFGALMATRWQTPSVAMCSAKVQGTQSNLLEVRGTTHLCDFPRTAPGECSEVASQAVPRQNAARMSPAAGPPSSWLTYPQAAAYCGWSVGHLRNLVSAGQIPVYGKPRMRRFVGTC